MFLSVLLPVGVGSCAVFASGLVVFVVAPGDSARAAAFDHHIAVARVVVTIVQLLNRRTG